MIMNLFVSIVFYLVIGAAYVVWALKAVKLDCVNDLLKDFVDVSPALLCIVFHQYPAAVFLMCCLMANEFIYDNYFVGAGLFAAGYGFASVFAVVGKPFDWVALAVALGLVVTAAALVIVLYKGNKAYKIGAVVYGFACLAPCVYAFGATFNPGFLALVVGDILLILNEAFDKKPIRIASDLNYFFGTCFVPLALAR